MSLYILIRKPASYTYTATCYNNSFLNKYINENENENEITSYVSIFGFCLVLNSLHIFCAVLQQP